MGQTNIDGNYVKADQLMARKIVAGDSSLVTVVVQVQDINDNPPQFVTKIFTGW